MSAGRFHHALVIGGSGMLAGFCRKLFEISDSVSVLARRESAIRRIDPRIVPVVCDYTDAAVCAHSLDENAATAGPPDLIVAWIHGEASAFRRDLARRLPANGRFVQILGSAHADPARPDLLEKARGISSGLPVAAQFIILGFVLDGHGSRWLRDAEISEGVYAALRSGRERVIVGTVSPWSAHP